MVSPVFTEGRHAAEFLVSEANRYRSRDQIVIASGADLVPGTVLGKVANGSATAAIKAGGNTGNGVISAVTIQPGTKQGVYTVRCIAAATNSGTFRVEDPDGFVLGDVAVAAAFNDDIAFSIADGATDWIVGDGFDITVAAGSGKYKALNLAGLDGSQVAVAILYGPAKAASADVPATGMTRACEVNGNEIEWPVGITNPQKAVAIAQLAAAGILVRY